MSACTLTNRNVGPLVWKRLGKLSTNILALGLHDDDGHALKVSFLLRELRRRVFAASYVIDKRLCTFLGRPPRISRRYGSCQLPLDLSDHQLLADEASIEIALSKLDSSGWNTSQVLCNASLLRAKCRLSQHREEVLELALGSAVERPEERVRYATLNGIQ